MSKGRLAPRSPEDIGKSFRIGFLLLPQFALMPYAAAIEPLRAANRLSGRALYDWVHFSPDGQPAQASAGIAISAERRLDEALDIDLLLVCAGSGVEGFHDAAILARLRTLARHGRILGGISGGPYVLARAGVLDGYRFTLHWDHQQAFREEFPDLPITANLYEIDRDRVTCSGGIAPLDLMHEIIAIQHGRELAAAVSDWFLHTEIRSGGDPQRLDLRKRFGVRHPGLLAALRHMEDHLETPLPRKDLAAVAGVSPRQLERLFRSHVGRTPADHYLDIRLRRARSLLQQSSLSVAEIAVACGFASASHFSRVYRTRFGTPPRTDRS